MPTRIAITVKSRDGLTSLLDPVFGRATAFLVVDLETRKIESELENSFTSTSQGAGTGAAALMKEKKVEAVISGRFGPKAYQALTHLGIEMWNAKDGMTVKDALDLFERGELEQMKVRKY